MKTATNKRLGWAAAGLAAALLAGRGAEPVLPYIVDPALRASAGYAVVWLPLIAGLVAAFWGQKMRRTATDLGLAIRPQDVLWGVGIGCLGRGAEHVCRLALAGPAGGVPTMGTMAVAWGVLAPTLVAPLLEETYFRGLIQRGIATAGPPIMAMGRRGAMVLAVLLSSVVFAATHVVMLAAQPHMAAVAGLATLAFGLLAGTLTAATGRLGGAIVGHVAFNGIGVLVLGAF
ncbi:CPBP family intramembrane glutamic endopeptidase [Sinomonas cyclohexanicum]|uniref:CPBP family intramembrane glutamic endopeptidase n=1 Tax=Sinomonas cyclohexanicum TaxID=322009 RepID=UPI001E620F26|nr:CPBP family intramembrane glutamic endopeptidase [Corynebacterium cyclohexanicum]